MPLFMDVHESLPEGATAADVAGAHEADLKVQQQYGVDYKHYWVDEENHKVFCLVEAPDQEGRQRDFQSLTGPNGLVLVFFRSADW